MIHIEVRLPLLPFLGRANIGRIFFVMRQRTPGVQYEVGRFSAAGKGKG